MKIEKLLVCEERNTIISLTRGALGFWNMETGALDFKIGDSTGGIKGGFFQIYMTLEGVAMKKFVKNFFENK